MPTTMSIVLIKVYIAVTVYTRPLDRESVDAVAVIRLDMIRGKMVIALMNTSPGSPESN